MEHIDVSSVLRHRVCALYSDLVTRPTGAAVRAAIEQLLEQGASPTLTVIDFTHVGLLDFSCADEVVAKLLLRYCAEDPPPAERYFVFRGVNESHLDAIEAVLERHALALVIVDDEQLPQVVGMLGEEERQVWHACQALQRLGPALLAEQLGTSESEAAALLDRLHRRRLLMRHDDAYLTLGGRPA